MQLGNECEVRRIRRLAVAAFAALSLPLVFMSGNEESQSASTHEPAAPLQAASPTPPVQPQPAVAPAKPAVRKRIIVSIRERKLAVVEQGRLLKTYPIAVGAQMSPSPTGEFKIVTKVSNPTYYRPGTVISPGQDNPLGSRWLGLDRDHLGIHGTNEPRSIGQAASHGCIRMAKSDVEELYRLANIGDAVGISEEPLPQMAQLDLASGEREQ